MLHYLPLAAEKAGEETEHVHQLRVWARRATAALILYEELMPRRRFRWMKKQLRRVRRAANDARDCDVLLRRLRDKPAGGGTERWGEAVRAERDKAEEAIVAAHERLGRDQRFARRIDKLLQRVRSRAADQAGTASSPFGDWARVRLRPVIEQFFAAVPSDPGDEAALHRFRICGKELRYVMELLAGAFPESIRTQLYPTIEMLQDRLGDINDLATAKARLRKHVEQAGPSKQAASWRRLLATEQEQLEQARQQFWQWCTPQMLQGVQDGFEGMLGTTNHPHSPENDPSPAARSVAAEKGLPEPVPAGRSATPSRPVAVEGGPSRGSMTKARIVSELGEQELLLPALVNEGLAANDRAKFYLTLLQAARDHADHPDGAATDLTQERLACEVGDADLDTVVARSRKEGPDAYFIPALRRVHDRLADDVRRMMAPLQAPSEYAGALAALLAKTPAAAEDRIAGATIDHLTSGQRDAGDSLHLLVMDLHKELNRLQQQLATETIDGASVYGVHEEDRPLVAAFMAGLNRTRDLKFDHPGLGTTATRSGDRLVIQNDIGLTEAHVLVIHVEGDRVTLTYTDVHLDRLLFFQSLFDRFAVQWQDTVSERVPRTARGPVPPVPGRPTLRGTAPTCSPT